MAFLLDIEKNKNIPLAVHHTFGRLASSVNTQIDKPYVSKLHAAIEWNGFCWRIKHLGLNDTWVNKIAVPQGETRDLQVDDLIQIADRQDGGYRVLDLSPPRDMLWPLDGSGEQLDPILLDSYNLLPDAQAPELALFFQERDQLWCVESIDASSEAQPLSNGDIVQMSAGQWQLMLAQVCGATEARTKQNQQLAQFKFVFNLSLDEETTELALVSGAQSIDLGVRTHHYMLLQLARHRAEDMAKGLDINSRGWVYAEQLAAELGLDVTHLNIQIFRARKQIADSLAGIHGQEQVLQRRGGKIRLGCENFTIVKGDQTIAQLPLIEDAVSV